MVKFIKLKKLKTTLSQDVGLNCGGSFVSVIVVFFTILPVNSTARYFQHLLS